MPTCAAPPPFREAWSPLWGESGRALPYAIWALRLQRAVGGGFRNAAGGVGGNFVDTGLAARRWGIGVVGLVFLLGIIHGECAKITMTHSPQKGKNSNINLFLLFPAPHTGVVPRFAEYLKVGGVSHPINVS